MGIADVDPGLASNRLIFDIRRELNRVERFRNHMEDVMTEYGLTAEEKEAWRKVDIKRLRELGVHPYFLPQISRIFQGGAYNHNDSAAAQLYAKSLTKDGRSPDTNE